jgi:hypothetical protein
VVLVLVVLLLLLLAIPRQGHFYRKQDNDTMPEGW